MVEELHKCQLCGTAMVSHHDAEFCVVCDNAPKGRGEASWFQEWQEGSE